MRYYEKIAKESRRFLLVNVVIIGHHKSTFKPANYSLKSYGPFFHHLKRGTYVLQRRRRTQKKTIVHISNWVIIRPSPKVIWFKMDSISSYPFLLRLHTILRSCRQLLDKNDLKKIRPQFDHIQPSLNDLRIDTC